MQLKSELRTEIVRDVTRKTVKQVLKGLDGAVIQSMKGGNAADLSEQHDSPVKMPDTEEPVQTKTETEAGKKHRKIHCP